MIVALEPQLGDAGKSLLQDLACATNPQGVYLAVPRARDAPTGGARCADGRLPPCLDLARRFEVMRHLMTGYWKATLDLSIPSGIPAGNYTITGRMFADTGGINDARGQPQIKRCDASTACPRAMECDGDAGRCFFRVTIPLKAP